ncbi:DUF7282 domain-containing protein [Halorussus salinus]|uniref:DUF7282 domain-containing protein n=1 Tax=Halorussus salinus TaxID=1364935 RepID=UPI00192F24F2|nr:hypothetical protein [Halorussus salinus]
MTRKTTVLAIAALMVVGSSAALAVGASPAATDERPLAQETETTTGNETGETTTADETMGETTTAAGQLGAGVQVTFLNQSAGVTFTDMEPNKTTVTIERVVVPEGGFLVVHEAQNVTGEYATEGEVEVGAVVGNSTYLEPGAHSNVVVELNESIDTTQTLVAMPHRDTNDNQQYEFPEADAPYTMDGSAVIDNALVIVDYDVIDATFGDEENRTTTEA